MTVIFWKSIFLIIILVSSISLVSASDTKDLDIEWHWNHVQLYTGNQTKFTIVIKNISSYVILIDRISLHTVWMLSNHFTIRSINKTLFSGATVDIPYQISVPINSILGDTVDFACIVDYQVNSDWKNSGVVRSPSVIILQGKSIYAEQEVSVNQIILIVFLFSMIVFISYSFRDKIGEYLKSDNRISYFVLILCFVVYSFSIYLNFSSWMIVDKTLQGFSITGDETHYVFVTQGLLKGTINSEDIYPLGFQRHDMISKGMLNSGCNVTALSLGLPILSMVPYTLGNLFFKSGVFGILLFVSFLMSLTVFLIYKTSIHITGSTEVSLLTSLAFAFSTTMFIWSGQIFSDSILSFFVMLGVYLGFRAKKSGDWVYVGLCMSVFPFIKYQAVLVTVGSIIVISAAIFRDKRNLRNFLLGSISVLIFYYIYLYLFVGLFNTSVISSVYDSTSTISIFGIYMSRQFWWGIFGSLIDSNSGLIFYSPILILSALGLIRFLKIKSPAVLLAVFISVFWMGATSVSTYWNGWLSPPTRYMIVILPLFSLPFALAVQTFKEKNIFKMSYVILYLLGLIANTLMATNRLLDYVIVWGGGLGRSRFIIAISKLFNISISIFPDFAWGAWISSNISLLQIWSTVFVILVISLIYIGSLYSKQINLHGEEVDEK